MQSKELHSFPNFSLELVFLIWGKITHQNQQGWFPGGYDFILVTFSFSQRKNAFNSSESQTGISVCTPIAFPHPLSFHHPASWSPLYTTFLPVSPVTGFWALRLRMKNFSASWLVILQERLVCVRWLPQLSLTVSLSMCPQNQPRCQGVCCRRQLPEVLAGDSTARFLQVPHVVQRFSAPPVHCNQMRVLNQTIPLVLEILLYLVWEGSLPSVFSCYRLPFLFLIRGWTPCEQVHPACFFIFLHRPG